MRAKGRLLSVLLLCTCVAACEEDRSRGGSDIPPPGDGGNGAGGGRDWFVDVTANRGIDFVHRIAKPDEYFMPDSIGGGGALFDLDNDGRLDLLLLQNAGPDAVEHTHRLYHQQADGTFADITVGSGLDFAGHGMGAAVGDVDNDGWPDVLITEYGGVRLLLNDGGTGRFIDATTAAGLAGANPYWASSAAFTDYDRDGLLDLIVVNYVTYSASVACTGPDGRDDYCGPVAFPPQVSRLFRNHGPSAGGDAPVFNDVTDTSGLGRAPAPGLGIVCADFTGDGWQDLLIANDTRANHLWVNQRDGTFVEEAVLRGIAYSNAGQAQGDMGIGLGDVNRDGTLDAYITHLTDEGNSLWLGDPGGAFRDATAATGLARPAWRGTGFGTAICDFDNDGWPDIAAVNGRIARARANAPDADTARRLGKFAAYAERNHLFANGGAGRFTDVSPANPAFCGTPNVARGLMYGDVDNDGGVDLIVTSVHAPARLFRNVAPDRGHWISLRAIDPTLGGRDAYGARIVVRVTGDHPPLVSVVCPSQGLFTSSDPRVHFGLGGATRVQSVEVTWPDGTVEHFGPQQVDRLVVLARGSGIDGNQETGGRITPPRPLTRLR